MKIDRPNNSHCEYAHGYSKVIVISDLYRIIICKDDWQWIIQKRCGIRHAQPRWLNLSYCRSSEALLRLWSGLHGCLGDVSQWSELQSLPTIFGGGDNG